MAVVSGVKFGVVASFVQFDAKKWSVDQKKAITKAMKEAAKAWLLVIIDRTPRDSGFLLAGFENLAAALGVSIQGKGLKRGLNAYGKNLKLADLEKRYKDIRQLAVVRDWLEAKFAERGKKPKLVGYKRTIPKALTKKAIKERVSRYKKKQSNIKRIKSQGLSDAASQEIGAARDAGLNIQKRLDSGGERKNAKLYRREKNQEFYARQRERKQADRLFRKLKQLRTKIKEARIGLDRALEKEPELKLKKRPKYYKWERVTVKKRKKVVKEIDVPNPAYPKDQKIKLAMLRAKTLPPATIKKVTTTYEEVEKTIKRRVKVGGDKDWVNIYRKFYYPKNGQKGPLKTPLSGRLYGTPSDQIFMLETSSGRSQNIAEETTQINKGGWEVPGKDTTLGRNFTPQSSLNSFKFVNTADLKISFNYGVDIRYWKIMDQYGRFTRNGKPISPKGAPWRGFVAANQAFQRILKDKLAAAILPFTSYIVKTNSKITPGFKGGL